MSERACRHEWIIRKAGRAIAFAGVAALSSVSLAQTTNISFEVSRDALFWSSEVALLPNTTYYVRMRVQLIGATALGLGGLTGMPTLSNWRPDLGDERLPFTFPGLNSACPPALQTEAGFVGRHVDRNVPTNTGRLFPFGAAGMSPTSASGLLTSFNDPGGILRFAGSKAATSTTSPTWGVSFGQLTPQLNGSCFNSSLDVIVFRYAVRIGSSRFSSLTTGVSEITNARATWLLNSAGTQTLNASIGEVRTARIDIPAAGSWGLIAVAGVAATRRRRLRTSPTRQTAKCPALRVIAGNS